MPQPRKYATRAQQQAAYRQRCAATQSKVLAQKGLPLLPAIPSMPGTARWNAMVEHACQLLSDAIEEMKDYHYYRTERWQASFTGEEFLEKVEHLKRIRARLEDID